MYRISSRNLHLSLRSVMTTRPFFRLPLHLSSSCVVDMTTSVTTSNPNTRTRTYSCTAHTKDRVGSSSSNSSGSSKVQFTVFDHNAPSNHALVEIDATIATSADEDQEIVDPFHPDHVPLNLMTVLQHNGVEIEGACGGELSCSTCHVLLEENVYDSLKEVNEEEEDMLDLAYGFEEVRKGRRRRRRRCCCCEP